MKPQLISFIADYCFLQTYIFFPDYSYFHWYFLCRRRLSMDVLPYGDCRNLCCKKEHDRPGKLPFRHFYKCKNHINCSTKKRTSMWFLICDKTLSYRTGLFLLFFSRFFYRHIHNWKRTVYNGIERNDAF